MEDPRLSLVKFRELGAAGVWKCSIHIFFRELVWWSIDELHVITWLYDQWYVIFIFVLVVVAPALHKARICIGLDTFRLEFRTTCESAKPHHRWVHWVTSPFAKASNSRWFRLPKGSKGHLMWLRPCETPIFYLQECYPLKTPNATCKQMQNMRKCCLCNFGALSQGSSNSWPLLDSKLNFDGECWKSMGRKVLLWFTLKCSHGPHQQPPGLEPANPVKAGDKATQSFSDSKHRPSDQFDSFDRITSVLVCRHFIWHLSGHLTLSVEVHTCGCRCLSR